MADPVMVTVPLELMLEIRDTLQECSEDLEAEIDARYPFESRQQYPTLQRRYTNDMEAPIRASHLVQAINMQPWAYAGDFNGKEGESDG